MAERLYQHVLGCMDETLLRLAAAVPQPKRIPNLDSFVYRYSEKNIHRAIVQKLACCISSLRAALLLMEHGYIREQAALQRMLDELEEDINFLAFGLIQNDITDLRKKYLDAFYKEEFDPETGKQLATGRRGNPRRKEVQAYLAKIQGDDPYGYSQAMRTISKTYSGYVHAASPQNMDLYIGDPPRFHTSGMAGTYRHDEHREDIWNIFYRGILAFEYATKALGYDDLFEKVRDFSVHFASEKEHDY
jgi:hypothetical protein